MKTLRLLTLFLMLAFIATACPSDTPVDDNTKCSPENVTGTCPENQTCKNGACIAISNECTPACDTWKTCEADNKCVLKAGKCDVKADCSANQECNNNSCEDATVDCNPACNSWETCESNGQCKLAAGRCNVLGDCEVNQICNEANRCENHIDCGTCDNWKECNFSTGNCEYKDGKCDTNGDCPLDKPVCDKPNHECISQSDVCSPICNNWEDCNAGTCELQTGKCNSHNDCTGEEKCTANHECKVPSTCTPACEYWEDCNAGTCELNSDFCDATTNCGDSKECSTSTHKCVDVSADPCAGQTCSDHGTCAVVGGDTATCICGAGYHAVDLTCIINNVNNPCDNVTCSGHGTCAVIGGNTAICVCEGEYTADGLNCINNDPCFDVDCDTWDVCNATTGICELKDGFCDSRSDCVNDAICTIDHTCESPAGCTPACEYWETCNVNSCELKTGYCTTGSCSDGQTCNSNHRCEADACANQTCSGHGTCVSNGGVASCTCSDGYIPNGLTCELNPACSSANPTGACADPCDTCNAGVCSNTTGYKCDGTFNAKCDPSKADVNGQHPDCAAGTFCNKDPDDETEGYCSYYGCQNDSECTSANYAGRSMDDFICLDYGANYNGVCVKMEDACTNPPRNTASYGSCDNSCGDGACAPADLCLGNICSPECDPNNNSSCQGEYQCTNVSTADNPMYRCLPPIETCGDDSDCLTTEACNTFALREVLSQEAILVQCGEPDGNLGDGGTCNPADNATPEQSCKDGLCLASTGATEGVCSAVCDSYQSCTGDDRFCFAYSPFFSDTDAAMPICVDNSIFTDLVYGGPCSQTGGCPANTNCSFQTVASVVTENSDIDYLCFGTSQPLTGSEFGENCTASSDCKSGYCGADGTCGAFCDTDDNCPSGKTCSGTVRYYADTVDNATSIKICQ